MSNRREFLKTGVLAGAGAMVANGIAARKAVAQQLSGGKIDNSYTIYAAGTPPITQWTEQLIAAIPVATKWPNGNPLFPGADYYEITMQGGRHLFHAQLPVTSPKKFTTWFYSPMAIPYLGPTIEAYKGTPVVVKFTNNLPDFHPVQQSIDPTVSPPEIYGVMPGGRVTPHMHGAFTAPQFDGHPFSWWTHRGEQGTHYMSLPGAGINEAIYYYCNQQPATHLWYHDHALGVTRLNVYAGLAGLYFLRDAYDTGAFAATGTTLNLPKGAYEVPLVFQDKTFNIDGSLFYPILGVTPEHPIWMPEFFGDTPVINGKCYPNMNVEPRRYRFRIVNGSQARFYNFWITKPNKGNMPIWQIGAEQGLFPAPVNLVGGTLLISPGERADIIVDFTGLPVGTILAMNNNANVPYPGGGGGPLIPQLMQFTVVAMAGTDTTTPPASLVLPPLTPLVVPPAPVTPGPPWREIAMVETAAPTAQGNQMAPSHMLLNERWVDDVNPLTNTAIIEETPMVGTTEVWQYINTTADTHPMHTHLVAFQVVNRQAFNAAAYRAAYLIWVSPANVGGARNPANKPLLSAYLVGAVLPPGPNELGFKDTVQAPTGFVTRVVAKYDVPDPGVAATGTTLPARYVYHCHILEHEENEMMRPFAVTVDGAVITNEPPTFWKPGTPDVASAPTEFALDQNYPNPFNPETTFRFTLPVDSHVELKIYNGIGQDVATVVDANYVAGTHAASWKAGNLASGPYFAKLTAGKFSTTKKVMLIK